MENTHGSLDSSKGNGILKTRSLQWKIVISPIFIPIMRLGDFYENARTNPCKLSPNFSFTLIWYTRLTDVNPTGPQQRFGGD